MQHYTFTQIDSWFFRESRSMDGSGATALDSVFPPANQTLLGALRTQIGEQYFNRHGGSWQTFTQDSELCNIIGYSQDYAQLKAQGAWLYRDNDKALYFPAPANLVQDGNSDDASPRYDFFELPDAACQTDLGNICLPQLKQRTKDIRDKPLEQYWLGCEDYSRVLRGEVPQAPVKQTNIVKDDIRLGISRNNQTRRTEDGMLYQTKHLRLEDGWHVYLGLDGVADEYCPNDTTLRFGGEARMAALSRLADKPALPDAPPAKGQTLILYLLTPLPDKRSSSKIPPLPAEGFKQQNNGSHDYWHGDLHGISVNIISAIVGKLQRIGGWDMAAHRSLPVRSFLPAGSCWYLECVDTASAQTLIDKLHLQYLTTGTDRALGYGQVAVGIAPDTK